MTTNQPSTLKRSLLSATLAEPWLADPVVLLRNMCDQGMRRMRWVPLRDVLKALSDAQGRITINGVQEHLNPLTIALLSSPFARDHFAALQTRLEAAHSSAKQATSAAQRPISSIPLHPSSAGSSQHPQLHLPFHPQRHQQHQQPHHHHQHQYQPHRPHHQQHPRHHLPPHQHNSKSPKNSFHKNKPLHKSWENPSTMSSGSGRGDGGPERRGPNRPSPDRLRKSADSTPGQQRRPSPSSASSTSAAASSAYKDKSGHQPHGRLQGRPSGGGEGGGGSGAERSQPSA